MTEPPSGQRASPIPHLAQSSRRHRRPPGRGRLIQIEFLGPLIMRERDRQGHTVCETYPRIGPTPRRPGAVLRPGHRGSLFSSQGKRTGMSWNRGLRPIWSTISRWNFQGISRQRFHIHRLRVLDAISFFNRQDCRIMAVHDTPDSLIHREVPVPYLHEKHLQQLCSRLSIRNFRNRCDDSDEEPPNG